MSVEKNDLVNLEDLKKMVMLTGRLSDIHIKTLQSAPFIYFDDLGSVEIDYEITTDFSEEHRAKNSYVNFKLNFNDRYEPDAHHQNRLLALVKTVQGLLWKEIRVEIKDQEGRDLNDV